MVMCDSDVLNVWLLAGYNCLNVGKKAMQCIVECYLKAEPFEGLVAFTDVANTLNTICHTLRNNRNSVPGSGVALLLSWS